MLFSQFFFFQNLDFAQKERVMSYNLALLNYPSKLWRLTQLSKLCSPASKKNMCQLVRQANGNETVCELTREKIMKTGAPTKKRTE
jgi:hypothetical protein